MCGREITEYAYETGRTLPGKFCSIIQILMTVSLYIYISKADESLNKLSDIRVSLLTTNTIIKFPIFVVQFSIFYTGLCFN